MTSVRARLEAGQTEFARAEFLKRRGNVPMCCYTLEKGPYGDTLVTCDQIKYGLLRELFDVACRICQREIAEKLGVCLEQI